MGLNIVLHLQYKLIKRHISTLLLFTIMVGLTPHLDVKADSINSCIEGSPAGDMKDYAATGESFDTLIESIKNSNFSVNGMDLNDPHAHIANYSIRLKGLSALATTDVGTDLSEFSSVIGLSKENNTFSPYYNLSSVMINNSKIDFNLDNSSDASFLHREDVAKLPNTEEVYHALSYTVAEFIYYADSYRKLINQSYNQSHVIYLDTKKELEELHSAYEWAKNGKDSDPTVTCHYKFIVTLWEQQGTDGDYGLSKLYELSLDDTNVSNDNLLDPIELDYTQPLSDFYVVNSENTIKLTSVAKMAFTACLNFELPSEEEIKETVLEDNNADVSSGTEDRALVTISDNIVKGIAYSAGYIPMQTNLYSSSTINNYDTEWLNEFHYKYGFMRKALFKDTSSTAAMDYYNSRGTTKGSLKVCTLRDFLELGEKDLVLYIDDDLYNSAQCQELVVEKQGMTLSNLKEFTDDLQLYYDTQFAKDETVRESSYVDNSYILEVYNVDMTAFPNKSSVKSLLSSLKKLLRSVSEQDTWESLMKDGDYSSYSSVTRNIVAQTDSDYIVNLPTVGGYTIPYGVVMDTETIKSVLDCTTTRVETMDDKDPTVDGEVDAYEYVTYDEYTPLLPYSYVSAIYRNNFDFNVASGPLTGTPVFIASDDVCQVKEATFYDRQSLLNYALVRNLNSMVQIDYAYSMDMDSPVYMDIYGNIVSTSGLVIIPAACNTTLFPDDYVDYAFAAGLFTCYGNDWHVPTSYDYVDRTLGSFFYQDLDNGVWLIDGKGINVDGTIVNFAEMSVYTEQVFQKIQEAFTSYLQSDGDGYTHLLWYKYTDIINEVMRGAPLEHIDIVQEGLETDGIINKTSIVAAAKLEALIDSLHTNSANSLLALPDFSSTEHSEYIVAFLLKLLIVATITVVLIAIYRDAVGSQLGFMTMWKCLSAVALTAICVTSIPALFELTYYGANKLLLQSEVTKICMYNLEKSQSGIEVGVTRTDTPSTYNKLMVQLDYVDVPWYKEMNELLFGQGLRAVDVAREEAMNSSQLTYLDDTTFYNDGIYMSVDDIYNSVGMDYTFNVGETSDATEMQNGLYLYDNGTNQTLSFYSPYYVFLKALTANINSYNSLHNTYMYTTKMQSGNRLKTIGLCSNYFQSKGFMEQDEDILHLTEVYGLERGAWYDTGYCFYEDEVRLMEKSRWYNEMSYDDLDKRIEAVNNYCREFIAENRELLDKVTDETFIKVMALSCAMKYNQVFGITEANCFEIYDLDSNDLLRLCLASTDDAMLTSPMSYPRFVLTVGGEAAVYAAAVLEMIMYVGSFIKPICVLTAYISVFMSIFVFRVILRRKSNNILGYIVTVLLLAFTNFLHAIILKASTYLPEIGLSTVGCILFIIIGQIAYLMFLGYVTGIALKDWYNLGANHYQASLEAMRAKRGSKNKDYLNARVPRYENNWDYYNKLVDQHRERNV